MNNPDVALVKCKTILSSYDITPEHPDYSLFLENMYLIRVEWGRTWAQVESWLTDKLEWAM